MFSRNLKRTKGLVHTLHNKESTQKNASRSSFKSAKKEKCKAGGDDSQETKQTSARKTRWKKGMAKTKGITLE